MGQRVRCRLRRCRVPDLTMLQEHAEGYPAVPPMTEDVRLSHRSLLTGCSGVTRPGAYRFAVPAPMFVADRYLANPIRPTPVSGTRLITKSVVDTRPQYPSHTGQASRFASPLLERRPEVSVPSRRWRRRDAARSSPPDAAAPHGPLALVTTRGLVPGRTSTNWGVSAKVDPVRGPQTLLGRAGEPASVVGGRHATGRVPVRRCI